MLVSFNGPETVARNVDFISPRMFYVWSFKFGCRGRSESWFADQSIVLPGPVGGAAPLVAARRAESIVVFVPGCRCRADLLCWKPPGPGDEWA